MSYEGYGFSKSSGTVQCQRSQGSAAVLFRFLAAVHSYCGILRYITYELPSALNPKILEFDRW